MAWVRYESAFVKHPKVQGIPEALRPGAIALHVAATGYCADLLTDGLVPVSAVPSIARDAGIQRPKKYLEALLHAGLFIDTGPIRTGVNSGDSSAQTAVFDRDSSRETPGFSGPIVRERSHIQRTFGVAIHPKERSYLIHDYLEYNPSRHAVTEGRKRASERQKRRRDRERQGVLDLDVTSEHHGVTSQAKSQRESRDTSRAHARARPVPSLESVSSQREEGLTREPSDNGLTPAAGSTRNAQTTPAIVRARLRIHAIGHELPANELDVELRDFLRDRYDDLTAENHLELASIHQQLLDPEPATYEEDVHEPDWSDHQ